MLQQVSVVTVGNVGADFGSELKCEVTLSTYTRNLKAVACSCSLTTHAHTHTHNTPVFAHENSAKSYPIKEMHGGRVGFGGRPIN